MSREINEKIHICSDDGKFAMKTVANFIANEMKYNTEIIFQSNFDFMQNDTPFTMHLRREDGEGAIPKIQINIISVDWQLFIDEKSEFIDGKWKTEYLKEWKTSCKDDDGTMNALDTFYHWKGYTTNIKTNVIDLKDDIYEWMVKNYIWVLDEYDFDFFNCGGFIVYEVPCVIKEE